jgi:hypothetical protein
MIPANMREVTKDEFFATLYADPRDIMPSQRNELYTVWEVVSSRAVWGWSYPGWKNVGEVKRWAVAR